MRKHIGICLLCTAPWGVDDKTLQAAFGGGRAVTLTR